MVKPYIIACAFSTLDGKTAPPKEIVRLGPEKKQEFEFALLALLGKEALSVLAELHRLRSQVDAVLVGEQTVIDDDSRLTVREVEGKNPTRVVLSLVGMIPLESRILMVSEAPTIMALTRLAPTERIAALKEKGVKVLQYPGELVDVKELSRDLYDLRINKLLLEGGATMRWLFFKEGLVDEYWSWVLPVFYGGTETLGLLGGQGFQTPEEVVKLEKYESKIFGQIEMTKYRVVK